jgi:uncharacterized membrane protein YeiH
MTPSLTLSTATLLFTLDLIGTFVFALSGAAAGVKNKLDPFGVGVLAFVAGNAGGVARDVLIGAVPPAAISDWRYVAFALAAGAVTFVWYPNVKRLRPIVLLLDAAGLGLCSDAGTQKALAIGVNPFVSALHGMLTGIGGGVLRDLLVNEIPVVLRADLYALAALSGAALVVGGHLLHWPPAATTIAGAILCFCLRLVAIRRGWNLPPASLHTETGP